VQIRFLGGAGEVGRLAVLMKAERNVLLLDYGISFDADGKPVLPLHVRPRDITAAFLSHAHLDHCGALPALYVSASVPVYATPLTMELSDVMYVDALKLSGYYLPYTYEEVERLMSSAVPVMYGERVEVSRDVTLAVHNAGHVPGSAMAVIEMEGAVILFTGDFNTRDTNLLRGADVQSLPGDPDVVIMEATYANAEHPPREKVEAEFVEAVLEVLERGGIVLVPAFALGRAQEVLLTLVKHGMDKYPIYVDGLARQINQIIGRYSYLLRDPSLYRKALDASIEVPNMYVRKGALDEPCVIIAPAGMLKGGTALYYFKKLAQNKKNGIFLPSFQAPNTPGFEILSKGYAVIDGALVRVEARLEWFDFSAHAGRRELEELARRFPPDVTVVLVHTDALAAASLVRRLAREGFDNIRVPAAPGETVEL